MVGCGKLEKGYIVISSIIIGILEHTMVGCGTFKEISAGYHAGIMMQNLIQI